MFYVGKCDFEEKNFWKKNREKQTGICVSLPNKMLV